MSELCDTPHQYTFLCHFILYFSHLVYITVSTFRDALVAADSGVNDTFNQMAAAYQAQR